MICRSAKKSGATFSRDGKWLAAGCKLGGVKIWDTATGRQLPVPNWDGRDTVLCVAFHPAKPILAVCTPHAEDGISIWNVDPLHEMQRLEGHRSQVSSCAWGPDGSFLVSTGWKDGTVRLWDMTSPKPQSKAIALGPIEILGAALSPDGRYLATANADGTIYVLHPAKPDEWALPP